MFYVCRYEEDFSRHADSLEELREMIYYFRSWLSKMNRISRFKGGKTMFHTADPKDIIDGKITDVYFERTLKVL